MSVLQNKIDFAVILTVKNANPNGDPLNGNRPREDYDGYGEISDVCIKRKIRNRLMDMGQPVFVQSDDRCVDGCKSLRERVESCAELKGIKDREQYARIACQQWADVRAFGQVFAFKPGKEKDSAAGVSVGCGGRYRFTRRSAFPPSPWRIFRSPKASTASQARTRTKNPPTPWA